MRWADHQWKKEKIFVGKLYGFYSYKKNRKVERKFRGKRGGRIVSREKYRESEKQQPILETRSLALLLHVEHTKNMIWRDTSAAVTVIRIIRISWWVKVGNVGSLETWFVLRNVIMRGIHVRIEWHGMYSASGNKQTKLVAHHIISHHPSKKVWPTEAFLSI